MPQRWLVAVATEAGHDAYHVGHIARIKSGEERVRQLASRTDFPWLSSVPVKSTAIDYPFERALSVEITASEQLLMRVLAGTLAVLLVAN